MLQLISIIIKNSCLLSTVMKATPYLEEVIHLAIRLLNDQGHEQIAEQLTEIYPLPQWIETNNPLIKKGLVKIIKEYVKSNEKMIRYYEKRVENQQTQEATKKSRKKSVDSCRQSVSPKAQIKVKHHTKKPESPVVSKAASPKQTSGKKSSWMQKFEKPKTLEELNEVNEVIQEVIKEQVPNNHSKTKKQKKAKIESSQYESEEDSFELEPKKKLKKQAKQEKKIEKTEKKKKKHVKSQSEAEQDPQEEEQEKKVAIKKKSEKPVVVKSYVPTQERKNTANGSQTNGYPKQTFSRINVDQVGPIREQLRDNSFQAKAKFGQQADHWGQFGYDKLKDTRGDSFKKTKGKLKNRAFQGALMDINKINSIPIV